MRVIGIVAEFNPFHNGHKYLIDKAREEVNDSRAVVMTVMSGSFTQRGEPASMPKHRRARQALKCGSDVVLELPFTFACAPSGRFGSSAVELLYRTGVVTDIAFGVDCGNTELLLKISDIIFENSNSEEFKTKVSEGLSSGESYPAARSEAVQSYFGAEEAAEVASILRAPNSILAIEYLLEIKKLRAPWKIHMIQRIGEGYSSTEMGEFSSASGIRRQLLNSLTDGKISPSKTALALRNSMPAESLSVLLHDYSCGEYSIPDYDDFLSRGLDALRNPSLDSIAYMGGDLSNYLRNCIADLRGDEYTWEKFLSKTATKHFTSPRIIRAMTSAILFQSEEFINRYTHVPYIRVLGFSKNGRYCLKVMGRGCAKVPVIHNISDFLEYKDEAITAVSQLDIAASDLQASLLHMSRGYERSIPPVTDIR